MKGKTTSDILQSLGEDTTQEQVMSEEFSHVSSVSQATSEAGRLEEVQASVQELHDACKADLNFLAAICMPNNFKFDFPPHFISAWAFLTEWADQDRVFPQLALGLPRGFAKSTLMKLFIVYCILFTNKKFPLILAATATLAENIMADITDMLEEPNVIGIFGDWKAGVEKDTTKIKKFGFRGRNIIMAALGAGGAVRGLNLKNERPDIMLFDDIQTREQADSEQQSQSLLTWFTGTAMKAKSPDGCMFLFCANMYPTKHSLLRKLKYNPKWLKFIVGGILADGTSLWEDLQPVEQLMAEYQNDLEMGTPEVFLSEVMNDENANASKIINLSLLPAVPYDEGDIPAGRFVIVDPSNDKVNSDDVAIGYFEVHNAKPMLMDVISEKMNPEQIIRRSLELAAINKCNFIAVEAQAFQYSLLYWYKQIINQTKMHGIIVEPIYSGGTNKNSRIMNMLRSYAGGELYVHQSCKAQVHHQITEFNPIVLDNIDDVLDLLTYSSRVMSEFALQIQGGDILEATAYELEVNEDYNTNEF